MRINTKNSLMDTFALSKLAEEARVTALGTRASCPLQTIPKNLMLHICFHLSIDCIRALKQTCRLFCGTLEADAVRRSHGRVFRGRLYYGDDEGEHARGDCPSKRCRMCLQLFLAPDGLVWTAADDFQKPLRALCWGCARAHGMTADDLQHLYFRGMLPPLCEYCHIPLTIAVKMADHRKVCGRQRRLEQVLLYLQIMRTLPLTVATLMSISDDGLPDFVRAPLWVSSFYVVLLCACKMTPFAFAQTISVSLLFFTPLCSLSSARLYLYRTLWNIVVACILMMPIVGLRKRIEELGVTIDRVMLFLVYIFM